jgi:Ca-activated chloride channel family protein
MKRAAILVVALLGAAGAGLAWPLLAHGRDLLEASWQARWWLLGLLALPLILWRGTLGEDTRTPRLLVGSVRALRLGPGGWRVALRDVPGALRTVALGFLILAMARPVSVLDPSDRSEEGIDVVLVLDLSGSMQAAMDQLPEELERHARGKRQPGVRPTRLEVAKAVIRDFVARRKTDRIGVVVFGKDAYVLSPPTLDYHLLDHLVSKMELNLIDGGATAIGEGLGVAVARLRRSPARSKAVILLTDGDNNSGKIAPEYAAHLATTVGAKVFTIQIGDGESGEVLEGFDLFGQPRYVTMPFPANPALLQKIAGQTGGESYVATDARALQASFHSVLDRLEKTKFEASVASFSDLFRWLLLPGVLLLALDALLRAWLLRRFP